MSVSGNSLRRTSIYPRKKGIDKGHFWAHPEFFKLYDFSLIKVYIFGNASRFGHFQSPFESDTGLSGCEDRFLKKNAGFVGLWLNVKKSAFFAKIGPQTHV